MAHRGSSAANPPPSRGETSDARRRRHGRQPAVAARRQAAEVVRGSRQDHRHLGGRGDPAARRGRVRRRPLPGGPSPERPRDRGFRKAAESSVETVAAVFDGWGPKVHKKIRSGSPAKEIIKAASQLNAGLVVVASGGRGISDTVLVGSTAQRVQHYAPCPVLVVRPAPRKKKK
ncbi:MAG: universal stress protein [Nocardioidaceae bacterium]